MGSIGGVLGGVASVFGAKKASDSADSAAEASAAASAAQLAFEKEKYEDWKETYGDVEDNLSEYYSNLTPDFYAARGLEAFEKEQHAALTGVRESLAQRGIADSGLAAKAEVDFGMHGASERAKIRAEAPGVAMKEQLGFLSIGLSGKPGASYSQALNTRASSAAKTADTASRAAGTAMQSAVTSVGSALDDYFEDEK